jgi:hypothetical protein
MISDGAESLELSRPGCGFASHDQFEPHGQFVGTAGMPHSSGPDLLIGRLRPPVRNGLISRLSGPELQSVLCARPWTYDVGWTIWLPQWLPAFVILIL